MSNAPKPSLSPSSSHSDNERLQKATALVRSLSGKDDTGVEESEKEVCCSSSSSLFFLSFSVFSMSSLKSNLNVTN